ncbi:MAG: hypothetical protein ABI758_01385 [Candidatus Woesebacteria bacterium]
MPLSRIEAEKALVDYVISFPYNNVAVILAFLEHLELQNTSITDALSTWELDSSTLIEHQGGTNCIGATEVLERKYQKLGIETKRVIFKTNIFSPGFTLEDAPYGHSALITEDAETNLIYLIDPGLGLNMLLPANGEIYQIGGKGYELHFSGDRGVLIIHRLNDTKIEMELIVAKDKLSLDEDIQKKILRGKTEFRIYSFDKDSKITAALKINIFSRQVIYHLNGNKKILEFDEVDTLFASSEFEELTTYLKYSPSVMQNIIRTLISRSEQIVSLWTESVQNEYFLANSKLDTL